MIGWQFSNKPKDEEEDPFERLFKIFKDLLIHTSGDVAEALSWLTELDKQYKLTDDDYGIADFINDLYEKGFLKDKKGGGAPIETLATSKLEGALRRQALNEVFDQLNKTKYGQHVSNIMGKGDESTAEMKPFEFGDSLDNISFTETIKSAQINHGFEEFRLEEDDIHLHEKFLQVQTSTVLMIDVSHSMILYGEDRITPAKKVAMALAELITTRFPKDTIDIIAFGNDAWKIDIKEIPYLQVGPFHTNTVAGLELAMDILRKRKNPNKQIMMITDGKPTCIKKGKGYYMNSFGLDRKILSRTLALAMTCRKINIPITTFMIARDPYLVQFVDKFTKVNNGKAFYSSLDGLGEFIFMDYKNNKRTRKK
ncbi:MAG: VWA domain-containing protein [Saprospiraceae bacterium]